MMEDEILDNPITIDSNERKYKDVFVLVVTLSSLLMACYLCMLPSGDITNSNIIGPNEYKATLLFGVSLVFSLYGIDLLFSNKAEKGEQTILKIILFIINIVIAIFSGSIVVMFFLTIYNGY